MDMPISIDPNEWDHKTASRGYLEFDNVLCLSRWDGVSSSHISFRPNLVKQLPLSDRWVLEIFTCTVDSSILRCHLGRFWSMVDVRFNLKALRQRLVLFRKRPSLQEPLPSLWERRCICARARTNGWYFPIGFYWQPWGTIWNHLAEAVTFRWSKQRSPARAVVKDPISLFRFFLSALDLVKDPLCGVQRGYRRCDRLDRRNVGTIMDADQIIVDQGEIVGRRRWIDGK